MRLLRARASLFALCLFPLAVACGGGGDGPPPAPAKVTKIGGDQQPGPPGVALPIPLSVRVTDANDAPVSGTTVTWSVTSGGGSVSPATSTTNQEGVTQTQWTLGPSAGSQTVTASAGGIPPVTFTATAAAATDCPATVDLSVGGVCLAKPDRAAQFDVNGGGGGAEFTAISYYDGAERRDAVSVTASASGVIAASGPPTPSIASRSLALFDGFAARLTPHLSFESRLRWIERRELRGLVSTAPMRRAQGLPGRLSAVVPGAPRFAAVGDLMTLNANANNACTIPNNRDGRIVSISTNAIIVADTGNPPGGFTTAQYDEVASEFESLVWPLDTQTFGTPTDIDANQKVIIFFTRAVNELTPASSTTGFVAGFFFSRDLFPRTQTTTPSGKTLGACATSNVAEMFYMLAPDPNGVVNNNKFSTELVKRITVGTVAHELQHLINSARRLYVNPGANWPETVWLEEGLSHIAEELLYYRATGFAPRQNLAATTVLASAALTDAFNRYMVANIGRLSAYLKGPETHAPYGAVVDDDDLETRGAIWQFMRYAADRRGSSDGDVWNRLVNAQSVGLANLREAFGQDVADQLRNWAAANYVDDAVGTGNPVFEHRSWDFRSILPRLSSNNNAYPLRTRALSAETTFQLQDGGAAYLRFGVVAGARATVRITASGGQLPSGAAVWVIRTK